MLNCYSVGVDCSAEGRAGRFAVNVVGRQSMRGLIAALHLAVKAYAEKEKVDPELCEAVSISVIGPVYAVDIDALDLPESEPVGVGTESLMKG